MRTPTVLVGLSGDKRLTMAGESCVSSDRRRAAAARKSVRANVDHLPGQFAIDARGIAGSCVRGDGPADERRLTELHGLADDAVEDMVVADDAQLVEHVPREIRPAIEERRQEAQDLEVAVQLEADRGDDLDQ